MAIRIFDVDARDEDALLAFQDGFGDTVDVGEVDWEFCFLNTVIHGVTCGPAEVFDSAFLVGILLVNAEGGGHAGLGVRTLRWEV